MSAILATFSDAKLIKTRSVLTLILEVPIERADEALRILGGVPQPGKEKWCGVALAPEERKAIDPPKPSARPEPDKVRKQWNELAPSAQAGIRCSDETFWRFLGENGWEGIAASDTAAAALRSILNVKSRAELNTDPGKLKIWESLESNFQRFLTDQQYASVAR